MNLTSQVRSENLASLKMSRIGTERMMVGIVRIRSKSSRVMPYSMKKLPFELAATDAGLTLLMMMFVAPKSLICC